MDSDTKPAQKTPMTDEERAQLAEKLDRELDEFIDGLEKRSYTEGWPEDRWQEEMEKHPFFMTKPPTEGQELSPLMEGLQQLKYDETDNTPEELATAYKDDGNFYYKLKKYPMAVISFTEGLRRRCPDNDLNAKLYNNRAAAHFALKNYRSCLNDCRAAMGLRENYPKACMRALQCLLNLANYDECIELCDKVLSADVTNKTVLDIRTQAVAGQKQQERNKRREEILAKKKAAEEEVVLQAIRDRGITLEPDYLHAFGPIPRVHLIGEKLVWPVALLYPEHDTNDLIEHFEEDATFADHLRELFKSHPEWDVEKKYVFEQLRVYWEDWDRDEVHQASVDSTLGQTLAHPRFTARDALPTFLVVVADSEVELDFRRKERLTHE